MSGAGASVIIPFGGAERLPLLEATLARLSGAPGVDQIVIAEYGTKFALSAVEAAGADHIFLPEDGPFSRVLTINAGSALARSDILVWCDCDLLLGADFMPRALEEMRAGGYDFFLPFTAINYLGETDSAEILAGRRQPADCMAERQLSPIDGSACGGMGMVSRAFLLRHGGMIEGFRGWGGEDIAWMKKAQILGRVGQTTREDQQLWHLFHGDSGSHSSLAGEAAARANPYHGDNVALMNRVLAVVDAEHFRQEFPPPQHLTPPWPVTTDILFLVAASPNSSTARRAQQWAGSIADIYGTVPVTACGSRGELEDAARAQSGALIAGFADDLEGRRVLNAALERRPSVIVPAPSDHGEAFGAGKGTVILGASELQRSSWRNHGIQTWHRCWQETETESDVPVIVQPLSQLAGPRRWSIRIRLDRANLPAAALDHPRFWYVGFHDSNGEEMLRADIGGMELAQTLAPQDSPIVIVRHIEASEPPKKWTVWPNDRAGRWLDPIVEAVDASCLDIS